MRRRRLLSSLFDLALLAAPWTPLVHPPHSFAWIALSVVAALANATFLLIQAALLGRYGRTLGMACLGLSLREGTRWAAVLLNLALSAAFLFFVIGAALSLGVMGHDLDANLLILLVPLGFVLLDLGFLVVGDGRSLIDRWARIRFVADSYARQPLRESGGTGIDVWFFTALGAPLFISALDIRQLGDQALAAALNVALWSAAELAIWTRTGFTIGRRAVLRGPRVDEG